MKNCIRILLASILLIGVLPLAAHTIILRNGQVFYGEVVQQDRQNIYVAMKGGKKTYAKSSVLKILFQEVKEEESLKRIIRAEVARQSPADTEEDIKIVDFNEYMKSVVSQESERRRQDRRLGAIWRSALLPGWGQWHVDQSTRGSTYAGLYIVSLAASAKFYVDNRKAVADYQEQGIPLLLYTTIPGTTGLLARKLYYDPLREQIDSTHRKARTAEASALLVWCAAMVNSVFFSPPAGTQMTTGPRYELLLSTAAVDPHSSADRTHSADAPADRQMGLRMTLLF